MVVTTSPRRRKSACPAGTRSTKIANATWSPSPHATTRQRIFRRSRDKANTDPDDRRQAHEPGQPVPQAGSPSRAQAGRT